MSIIRKKKRASVFSRFRGLGSLTR
jgi:hypothetical protein